MTLTKTIFWSLSRQSFPPKLVKPHQTFIEAFLIHLTTFFKRILPLYVWSIFTGFLLTESSFCTSTSFFKSSKNWGRSFCRPQGFPTGMSLFRFSADFSLFGFEVQYGSGKRTNFFFHFADQFYNPRFSAEWFGVNHSEWESFTWSYALDIPRTLSGPQCTHDIRSICEWR